MCLYSSCIGTDVFVWQWMWLHTWSAFQMALEVYHTFQMALEVHTFQMALVAYIQLPKAQHIPNTIA
jgi:hypothetical protein